MKQTIRLTESNLRDMIKEAVNQALNEIGDTERGQYALGAVQARADMRSRNALRNKNFGERGDVDTYNRNDKISSDASKTSFKHTNDSNDAQGSDEYWRKRDLYNANQRGYRNYMNSKSGAGNEDYRTAPQTRKEVGY